MRGDGVGKPRLATGEANIVEGVVVPGAGIALPGGDVADERLGLGSCGVLTVGWWWRLGWRIVLVWCHLVGVGI